MMKFVNECVFIIGYYIFRKASGECSLLAIIKQNVFYT